MSDGSVTMPYSEFQCDSCNFHVTNHSQSNVGAVSRGWRIHFAADLLDVIERGVTGADLAFEHLLVSLPEVLRQEGVDDRVDR